MPAACRALTIALNSPTWPYGVADEEYRLSGARNAIVL